MGAVDGSDDAPRGDLAPSPDFVIPDLYGTCPDAGVFCPKLGRCLAILPDVCVKGMQGLSVATTDFV